MADSQDVKQLKQKYADRMDPTEKQKEAGVIPLTNMQKAVIEQGIDPESGLHWSAGDTFRNNKRQAEEVNEVAEVGDKAANLSGAEDRKDVPNPERDAAVNESEVAAKEADERAKAAAKEAKEDKKANK